MPIPMQTPQFPWKSETPARAWAPGLDWMLGNPFDLCTCGHERQSHDMSWLNVPVRNQCVVCRCSVFTPAPEYYL